MKHHFADFLDREGDCWTVVPNINQYAYSIDEEELDDEDVKITTITKKDKDWERVFNFSNLEELTLHEASKVQREALPRLSRITRLRITHARPKIYHLSKSCLISMR